jgi:3-hydroxyisobutyrate dehydrogenase
MGHEVTVWNRSADRAASAVGAGATLASELSGIVDVDIILISLTDATAVEAVIDGLIAVGIDNKLIVDMSTLLPDETRAVADKVAAAGADFIDCPVGGTVGPALKGMLLGMAGGTDAAVARARPVLDQLCKRVEHLGPVGSGAAMKLAVNLPLALYWQTLAEALTVLEGSGIAPETAISVIADSSGGPAVLKNRAQVVIDTLNGTDQPGTFDINGLAKDLDLALNQAAKVGRELPVSTRVRQSYDEAIAKGLGGFDGASLTRHLTGA